MIEQATTMAEREQVLRVLARIEEDDPKGQRETWAQIKQALDEDRPGQRQLFPDEHQPPLDITIITMV